MEIILSEKEVEKIITDLQRLPFESVASTILLIDGKARQAIEAEKSKGKK